MNFRQVADTAAVAKSFSKLEQAVLKATRCIMKPPKEKHVRTLLLYCSEQPHRNNEMISLLTKRLELPEWIVVLKTLIVFHRLFRDSRNLQFLQDLKYKSEIFNLRKFADISSQEAHHQSIFIRKYSQYLEEKIVVFKFCEIEFEKNPTVTKEFTQDQLFERLPRLQSQLNALINCRASKEHLNNPIIITAWNYLLKDSFKLYRGLNDGIIVLLETFFTMPKPNAVKALDIYKLFTRETDGLIQVIEISRRFAKSDLPELQHAPTTLVEALENHVKEIESGKPLSNSSSQATKALVNQTNKSSFASFEEKDLFDFSVSESNPFDDQGNSKTQNPVNPSFGFDAFAEHPSPDFLPTSSFDPFGLSTSQQPTGPSYDEKKKQIQNLFSSSPPPFSSPQLSHFAPSQPVTNFATSSPQPVINFANFDSAPQQTRGYSISPPSSQTNNANPFSNPFSSPNTQQTQTTNTGNSFNPFL